MDVFIGRVKLVKTDIPNGVHVIDYMKTGFF
jgi:hypothetical protein